MPIGFNAVTKPPFYLSHNLLLKRSVTYNIDTQEQIIIYLEFDPDLSGDKECRNVYGTLKIFYHEHPKQV